MGLNVWRVSPLAQCSSIGLPVRLQSCTRALHCLHSCALVPTQTHSTVDSLHVRAPHMQSKWRWWVVAQTSSGKSRFGHSQTGKSSERRRSAKVQSHNLLVIVIRTERWTRICVDLHCRWRLVDPA